MEDQRNIGDRVSEMELALAREVAAHAETRRRLQDHRTRLRELALQLCLTEAQERRAIASDLHDHVGQGLAMIRIRMEEFKGNSIFCGFTESIEEMLRLLTQTITYTRDLTGTISPPVLFELGLVEALDWLADRMKAKRGLEVSLHITGEVMTLSDEQKIMVFRSAQELLLNVYKHARIDKATMGLHWFGDRLELEVVDEGLGFSEATMAPHGGGFGLFSIRERMRQLGGKSEVTSCCGQGTRVLLSFPLFNNESCGT